MARVDLDLPESELDRLRLYAARRRMPVAEALRRLVATGLEGDAPESAPAADPSGISAQALALLGAFRDREGCADVAENHDRYLADAVRS